MTGGKSLVSRIPGPHERKLTDGFQQLLSHYLCDYRFCRVRRPNEKEVVEGVVKYCRLNFLAPATPAGAGCPGPAPASSR